MSSDKSREYLKYKNYQERFQWTLNVAENPAELNSMTPEQLLNAYSKVENMYLMRTQYRNRYYTPENWDLGHQQFIGYLIGVMEVYVDELRKRFENIAIKQKQREQQIKPSKQEITQNQQEISLGQTLQTIKRDVDERIREEEEIWNTEIPNLIKQNAEVINRRRFTLIILKRLFSRYVTDITDAQTIDVVQYVFSVWWITNQTHIFDKNRQLLVNKLPKRPDPWEIGNYSLELEIYVSDAKIESAQGDIMKQLLTFFNYLEHTFPKQFPAFIETILDITSVSRKYDIVRATYLNYLVYVPHLQKTEFYFSSVGKTVLAFNINDYEEYSLVQISSAFVPTGGRKSLI